MHKCACYTRDMRKNLVSNSFKLCFNPIISYVFHSNIIKIGSCPKHKILRDDEKL